MKRIDYFFVYTFIVSFLLCAVVMTGDYLGKQLERNYLEHGAGAWKDRQEEYESRQEDIADGQVVHGQGVGHESIHIDGNTEAQQMPQVSDENMAEILPGLQHEQAEGEPVKAPLTFETAGYEYFEDALFIGDSRTVGLMEYGNIEKATFFADSGMSVFALDKKKVSVSKEGKITFDEVLKQKQYGKIYLMLGINELGYRFDTLQAKYRETVEKIREQQSDAIIYLCANMHVTDEQSAKDEIYNNENVNRVNEMISGLADNETVFYIDVNELFDDAEGNLSTEYSSDAFHVYGKYYMDWVDWLCTKAILRPENS